MKGKAILMELPFLHSFGSPAIAESDHFPELDHSFVPEKSFNELLALERKRTARSKRPFILMLLNITEFSNGDNGCRIIGSEFISYLNTIIRDTDTIGWYLCNKVIGIIFTEIGDKSAKPAADKILGKVKGSLVRCLEPEEANLIRISLFFYPEESGYSSDKSNPEPILYHDIVRRRSMKKVSFFLKRTIDIIGSIVLLLSSLPVMITVALLVRFTSEGPVLFKQERVGQLGKRFTFLKFRSMCVNNDPSIHKKYICKFIKCEDNLPGVNGTNKVFKITDDPRVTPIGRILRKTSLDELPQLFNVLKGDMSLVGPRPPIPYELENYDIWHRSRILEMKPGLTGLWQVYGRSRSTFDEMVRLDIRYTNEWSVWMDIKLLLHTPWAVVMSKGAY
jgi:lipopolysaccharide/colanic/teichoic acid biosynthesis glycosyltransferase